MCKEEKTTDLEKSFHEQFAINQNHHQDILFKLLSIIGAVIVGYGYILHGYDYKLENNYSFNEALFGFIVSEVLLIVGLAIVVINANGFRRDQNICYRIRLKSKLIADCKKNEKKEDIFPYSFYPFDEKPYCIKWMPDFHKLFIYVFMCFQILTGIALIVKSIENKHFSECYCVICFFFIISIVVSIIILHAYLKKIRKIYNREIELKNKT